jgi:nicotinamide-nucleotide adenylyltransferase
MVKRGVFVGRFQPFHTGHLVVIKNLLKEVDELVIVIGSSQHSHSIDNPFTAGERLVMVCSALKEAGILHGSWWVVPVPDVHVHMMWISQVIGYTPKFEVAYSNEPLTSRLFKEAGFEVKPIPFVERGIYSSTEIRKRMLAGKNWEELVPKSVATFIKQIDGIQRLRDLNKTDSIQP